MTESLNQSTTKKKSKKRRKNKGCAKGGSNPFCVSDGPAPDQQNQHNEMPKVAVTTAIDDTT